MGRAIEILVLLARAHQWLGDIAAALVPLSRALKLAESEGYVRLFVDEGPAMAYLLREAAARGVMPDYTGTLLAAFPEPDKETRRQGERSGIGFSDLPVSWSPGLPVSGRAAQPA